MKVIEFNGVPGCGKSTICMNLYENYLQDGKKVIYYCTPLKRNIMVKAIQCGFVLLKSLIIKKHRKLLSAIINFGYVLFKMNNDKLEVLKSMYRLFKILIIADYCLKKEKLNQAKIILIDQGIIQYIVSALYRVKFEYKDVDVFLSGINTFTDDWYIVECSVETSVLLNRLKKRSNGGSRVEKLQYRFWEKELTDLQDILNNLRQQYNKRIKNRINIDTTINQPADSAKMIMNKIEV